MPATSKQKEFNNVLQQIKEEQRNIDMNLFKNIFDYETPDEILEYLHEYNQETSLIEESFKDFKDMIEAKSEGNEKNKAKKILNFVDKILNFTLKEWKQQGQGLKILTPNQMLSRLTITLAQLAAGNN